MKKYSELELMDLIGELELWGYNHLKPLFEGKHDTSHQMYKAKSKLYDLMVKYKVTPDYIYNSMTIWEEVNGFHDRVAQVSFNDKSEIPRAIIMCILKSKNII